MGYTPRFRPQAEFSNRGFVIKRTFQPKKRYKRRVHGFLQRMSTRGGARVLRNRRRKGRHQLTPA